MYNVTELTVIAYQTLSDIQSLLIFLIWQPPILPHRLQCSTVGRLRLNHRVRDGNGCDP